jgi:hypothetical protein
MVMTTDIDILEPALSRQQALNLERHATRLYDTGQRTVVQFAADLYRLQEGQAHLLRGFTNFGEYASTRFEGLGSVNAMQIARQGRVLVALERMGRIDIDKGENLPGTTGLRSLAKILKDLGEDAMLAIHDKAALSGKVTDERVAAATTELIGPKVHELGEGIEEPPEEEPEEDDDGYTEEHSELLDKMSEIHDCLYALSDAITGDKRERARQRLAELQEEVEELAKAIETE